MSYCIHEEVCGTCDVEPEDCAYYEQRRGKCRLVRIVTFTTDLTVCRFECSECHEPLDVEISSIEESPKPRFCPWCGREAEQ